jgi:hypothetical protein
MPSKRVMQIICVNTEFDEKTPLKRQWVAGRESDTM